MFFTWLVEKVTPGILFEVPQGPQMLGVTLAGIVARFFQEKTSGFVREKSARDAAPNTVFGDFEWLWPWNGMAVRGDKVIAQRDRPERGCAGLRDENQDCELVEMKPKRRD